MRRLHLIGKLFVLALLVLGGALLPARTIAASVVVDPVLQKQLASALPTQQLSVIVTFEQQPSAADLQALTGTGAAIAPLRHLPSVGALATPVQLELVKQLTGVRSIYANRPLAYFLRESVPLIGAPDVWQDYGFKGDGVGVAVLDTGVDATHADLTLGDTTVENVKIAGLQYFTGQNLNTLPLPEYYLAGVPNSDTTGGHGTHVAGIIGASGDASGGYYQGVAPEADLIGLGAGEGIAIMTALAGFDWILEHQAEHNIRVVNCSWGPDLPNGFDPDDPVNVATKLVHDAGIAVVFAAGNSGPSPNTMNSYSVAPWVISVAAGGDTNGIDVPSKTRLAVAGFSSRGIPGDSLYHPTLTAPGYLIVSDRASTGAATNASTTATDAAFIPPEHVLSYTTASGTSMAAPHVAGAIALMVQANPGLTPDVIKRVLVNTATPMPNYQQYAAGAGYLNVKAAVDQALQIKNIRSYRDPRTGKSSQVYDQTSNWTGTVGVSLPGKTASDIRQLTVAAGTVSLDISVDWNLAASDLNLYLYDPHGNLAAQSENIQAATTFANESVHLNEPEAGTWTVKVSGSLNAPQEYKAVSNAVVRVNP
ncbi:MAG: S8 family serine peptidase [Chloroflexota bacterium]|nr:S8 family serine peptidase [Chloroflexota bacterium]